jgi:hypothetical protein
MRIKRTTGRWALGMTQQIRGRNRVPPSTFLPPKGALFVLFTPLEPRLARPAVLLLLCCIRTFLPTPKLHLHHPPPTTHLQSPACQVHRAKDPLRTKAENQQREEQKLPLSAPCSLIPYFPTSLPSKVSARHSLDLPSGVFAKIHN